MTSTITSKPKDTSQTVLHSYANTTGNVQVIRSADDPERYFERVVFPGERLFFEAPLNTELEVFASHLGRGILVDRIAETRLRVEQL